MILLFFRVKAIEVIFESYPQLILGIFILQGLQIQEPLNIASCTISTVSVVFGFGDYLAYVVNNEEAGALFIVSIWGVLANVIDSLFRAILIAYLLTIVKHYALLVVPIYVAFMFIAICIKKKELSINSDDFFGTLMSFGCSPCEQIDFYWKGRGYEKRIVKYRFRALSKVTFGLIFPPILGFLLYATIKLPNIHNDLDIDLKNTTICQNICPSQFESSNELNKTMVDGYCRSIWRHFEISPDLHFPKIGSESAGILTALGCPEYSASKLVPESQEDWTKESAPRAKQPNPSKSPLFAENSKNRTRTIITTIGVFWGIFIYLALAGSAKGLENGFDEAFSGLSKNSMGIWAQSTEIPYKGFEEGRRPIFQLSDVDYIKDRIPEIQYISPGLQQGAFSGSPPLVVRGLKSDNFNLFGNFPDQANISVIKIYEGGRYINDEDIKYKRKVAVIGEGTQERLFDQGEDPLGEYIRINDINFKVVGVEKFTEGSGFGSDSDITIPYTTFAKIFNRGDKFGFMFISGYDYVNPNYLEETIIDNLKVKKIVHPDDDRAFGSFNIGSLFESIIKFTRGMVFLSLVVGIATIFAGVIGIGNIMLIAVKERTNELGIRRALGATPGEVKVQIVLESVFLTILAGIVGIIVGAFLLFIINIGTSGIEEFPFTNPTVPLTIVFGAFVIMVTLGTLIGLIPAERAVSIKPIEALREE